MQGSKTFEYLAIKSFDLYSPLFDIILMICRSRDKLGKIEAAYCTSAGNSMNLP